MSDTFDRVEILLAPDRHRLTVTEVCRRYGISRDTFYAYRRRYQAGGLGRPAYMPGGQYWD